MENKAEAEIVRFKADAEIVRLKQNQISQMKGDIMMLTVLIDADLSKILADYFVKSKKRKLFFAYVTMDEQCTSSLKIRVLNRLHLFDGQYKEFKRDLNRVFEIRNIIAHSIDFLSQPTLQMYRGIAKDGRTELFEDLAKLWAEFLDIYLKVAIALSKVRKKINPKWKSFLLSAIGKKMIRHYKVYSQ